MATTAGDANVSVVVNESLVKLKIVSVVAMAMVVKRVVVVSLSRASPGADDGEGVFENEFLGL